jgi:hypothetical protein
MFDAVLGNFGRKLSKAKSMPNKLNTVGLGSSFGRGHLANALDSSTNNLSNFGSGLIAGFSRKRDEWRFKSAHPARKKPVISPPLPPKTPPPLPPKVTSRERHRIPNVV